MAQANVQISDSSIQGNWFPEANTQVNNQNSQTGDQLTLQSIKPLLPPRIDIGTPRT